MLFVMLILHSRLASVNLQSSISLMDLVRPHTTVEGDCKREVQVETRTWQPSYLGSVNVCYA